MMASRVVDDPNAARGLEIPRQTRVFSRRLNTLISVNRELVLGCTEIERLSRVPGSQARVAGVLLFRGEPIPVVSLPVSCCKRHAHKSKQEAYALLLLVGGMKFAVEVDEVPRMTDGPLPRHGCGERTCLIKTRHLEKFFRDCILRGRVSSSAHKTGKTETDKSNGVSPDTTETDRADGVSADIKDDKTQAPQLAPSVTDCCAR
jgi:hypothetical protein